jgi:phage FluMu protein Com
MKTKFKIKKDQYLKNRKGYSQIYALYCAKCNELLAYYQKDGSGDLLRIYVDRINHSKYSKDFKEDKKFLCPKCKRLIGLGYIYKKENRPSYRLFQNAIKKKPVSFFKNIKFFIMNLIKG